MSGKFDREQPTARQLQLMDLEQWVLTAAGASAEANHELTVEELRAEIRTQLLAHLELTGLTGRINEGQATDSPTKEEVRAFHSLQRSNYRTKEQRLIAKHGRRLLHVHFANGAEVVPEKVQPEISVVQSETEDSLVFRLATLLWSVPVSRGYGRRLRFLVRDRSNGRLMGIFALADPVFNLSKRDEWIGWSLEDRRRRLVNVMDAYILGAVPPYSQLLGAKVVAAAATSSEVVEAFRLKYEDTQGIISEQKKHAKLVLLTVTSALGKSSVYNRLRLPGLLEYKYVGETKGWGHFQVPDDVFLKMRRLLTMQGYHYAWENQYGKGPNWRIRVARQALAQLDLHGDVLKHGIKREIYAAQLSPDALPYLRGDVDSVNVERPSVDSLGLAAVKRWLVPRAVRRPDYRSWTLEDTWEQMTGQRQTTE